MNTTRGSVHAARRAVPDTPVTREAGVAPHNGRAAELFS